MSRRRRPSDLPQRAEVAQYIAQEAQRPLTLDDVADRFKVKEDRRAALQRLIDEMVQRGEILRTRLGLLAVPGRVDLMPGRIQGTRRGDYWFIPEEHESEDLRVAVEHLKGAMHGDRVLARRMQGRSGEVVRIVSRARETMVGRIENVAGVWFVRPQDGRDAYDIIVPDSERLGAEDGELVVCRVTAFGDARRGPVGAVSERLGAVERPGVDVLAIIRKHNLPEAFPEEVLHEATRVAVPVDAKEIRGRTDLRDITTFTIDSDDARDLDDAISLQATDDGWRLGVHIADVGHYVREGTALDREAYRRGTSVYLVDRVIPMLPEPLSNDICSLNPKVDRLTLSILIDLDTSGRRLRHQLQETVIRTVARLSYSGVNATLDGHPPGPEYAELAHVLFGMARLRDILGRRRRDRGAIDFEVREFKVRLDEQGKPLEILRRERTAADQLIEEFMLQANEAIAEIGSKQNLPFLYRVHEEPDPEKLSGLRELLQRLGYAVPQSGNGRKLHPKALQDILRQAASRPERDLVNAVMLRTMARARYDVHALGHFGLAAPLYTHFTSPIRRYPDLVVHRILKEHLRKKPLRDERREDLQSRLPDIAANSSDRERLADEAERETVDLKKVEFMVDRVGEEFDGIVSGVMPFGVFVELSVGVEGLLRVSSLTDDYYHYDEKLFQLQGERTRRTFRLTDPVRVRVERVNPEHGEIDLGFVAAGGHAQVSTPGEKAPAAGDAPAEEKAQAQKRSRRSRSRKKTGAAKETAPGSGAAMENPQKSGAAKENPQKSGAAKENPQKSGAAKENPQKSGAAKENPQKSAPAKGNPQKNGKAEEKAAPADAEAAKTGKDAPAETEGAVDKSAGRKYNRRRRSGRQRAKARAKEAGKAENEPAGDRT